jgi:hypothetical protein
MKDHEKIYTCEIKKLYSCRKGRAYRFRCGVDRRTTRWPGFGSSRARVHRSGSPSGVGQGRVGLSHSLKPNNLVCIVPYGQLISPEIARTKGEFENQKDVILTFKSSRTILFYMA